MISCRVAGTRQAVLWFACSSKNHKGNAMSRLLTLATIAAAALSVHPCRWRRRGVPDRYHHRPARQGDAGMIGRFDAIAAWLPGVESSPADKGNDTGSVRVITLKAPGNPTVTERLTATTPMGYSYAITQVDPKVLPVTAYTSTISVAPSGAGSVVTWQGSFQPAGGATDAAARHRHHRAVSRRSGQHQGDGRTLGPTCPAPGRGGTLTARNWRSGPACARRWTASSPARSAVGSRR